MKVYHTKNIRNVALLGHAGSGKTTLSETMLFEAGVISRRGTIQEQNTVSDHYNVEKDRGSSVFCSLLIAPWKESKINLLDTPGNDNFIGEVVSALRVADTAVVVLNATQGVEVGTEIAAENADRYGTPTILAINQCDHEKSNFDQTVEQAKKLFGTQAVVVQYPYNQGVGFNSIIDVLKMVMYKFPDGGGKPEKVPIPDEEKEKAEELHQELVETVAEFDETLMEAFFEKGSLDEEEMAKGLKLSLLERELFPIFVLSAERNMGSGRLMGFIHDNAPTPADREATLVDGAKITCALDAKPVVFFYKTLSEPHVGEVSYFKVFSGKVKSGDDLYNVNQSKTERLNQLFILHGKERTQVEELQAGDIGIAVKLKYSKVNETLTTKDNDIQVDPIHYPAPRIRAAISTDNKKDMEKITVALNQISKEDPSINLYQSKELSQTIISGQGELHLAIVKYRLEKVYNLDIKYIEPKIPYRETITKMANGDYRHKKQSGGSGQFGEVHMRIEPYYEGMPDPSGLTVRDKQEIDLEWGGKLAFYWCIVGGSIDAKYSNAIIKGIMQKMENGPLIGSNVRDVRVSVYDGKMHSVDSNDMAFQLAAANCFQQVFVQCSPIILEPIYDLEVRTPDEVMGDIMGDLQTRNAIILGMEPDGSQQKIKAKAPLRNLYRYSSTLRSLSQGRAKHNRKFHEYNKVSHEIQEELIKKYEESKAVNA